MSLLRFALTAAFLMCAILRQSNSTWVEIFQRTAEGHVESEPSNRIPPSPSPAPETNTDSGNGGSPVDSQKREACEMVPSKCDIMESQISSCFPFLGHASSREEYVLIMNDGDSALTLNVTFLPTNHTLENIDVPGHQTKKVKLPANMELGCSSILLNSKKGSCTMHMRDSIFSTFSILIPINGAYLLFVSTVLFVGGIWMCCKLRREERHLDGGKYQELEMGQKGQFNPFAMESPNDWDRGWDDDWDVEKR